jgi:hypothetical protein
MNKVAALAVAPVLAGAAAMLTTCFVGASASASPSARSTAAAGIGLFQFKNYGGCAYYTSSFVAMYNMRNTHWNTDPSCTGNLNDTVSSVSNGYYCAVKLFTTAGYVGNSQTLAARSQVTSVKYDNQYSSWETVC